MTCLQFKTNCSGWSRIPSHDHSATHELNYVLLWNYKLALHKYKINNIGFCTTGGLCDGKIVPMEFYPHLVILKCIIQRLYSSLSVRFQLNSVEFSDTH
jgi:hypothetical protein